MINKLKKLWYKHKLNCLDCDMTLFAIDYKEWREGVDKYEKLIKEKEKVYCMDCHSCWGNSIKGYVCAHKAHVNRKDTPYEVHTINYPIKKFNKRNDCKNFGPNYMLKESQKIG